MISRRFLAATGACALASALAPAFVLALAQDSPAQIAPDKTPPFKKTAAFNKTAIMESQQKLAAKLIVGLASDKPGATIALSPMSAFLALAILAPGADDNLQASLRGVLQLPDRKVKKGFFHAALDSLAQSGGPSPLLLANRLVLDTNMQPSKPMMEKLKGLGVEVSEEDLASPETLAKLNAWVNDKTKGLIPAIIDAPPGPGGLVALNALYFKDRWKAAFDPAKTKEQPFTGLDGQASPVAMMSQEGSFRFRTAANLVGIDLDFVDPRFGLVIVTTTDKPSAAADLAKATEGWLTGQSFDFKPGAIAMPRLQIETSNDLLAPLKALGLKDNAKSLQAFGAGQPRISAIGQRATLKLDEEGAEAAAATAVVATRSIDSDQVRMVVDKPYMFALRDKSTGFIIMAGYVGRPGTAKA